MPREVVNAPFLETFKTHQAGQGSEKSDVAIAVSVRCRGAVDDL